MLIGANTWFAFFLPSFREAGNKTYIFQTSLQLGFYILIAFYQLEVPIWDGKGIFVCCPILDL